ncbi:MAG: hypothetical protein R3E02_11415 [Blastomonas sp.]
MSRDYEPISARGGKGTSIRTIGILLAIAFIGGAIATGWVMTRTSLFGSDEAATAEQQPEPAAPVAALEQRIRSDGTVRPPAAPVATGDIEPDRERALATRVADLEDRISRINVQAQAASGNAGRAEGLLIALAARRALDRGAALDYLEDQLKLRFGAAQPNAVATIIAAGRAPITMDQLRSQLDEIGPTLVNGRRADEGFFAMLSREASELFVLRREGTDSPAPEQGLLRAKRALEAGRVDKALAEVRRLPGSEKASVWIDLATRYVDARTALDLIETAALLEPRALRSGEGEQVDQPSPVAPGGGLVGAAQSGN